MPEGPPDDRFLFLSDVLPTAWQAVEYAGVPDGGSVVILGLGPIGDMSARVAQHRGYRVIDVDLVPERLDRLHALYLAIDIVRHDLADRRLRRHGRPDADADAPSASTASRATTCPSMRTRRPTRSSRRRRTGSSRSSSGPSGLQG